MTDLDIFKHYVDLTDSALIQKQKDSFYNILILPELVEEMIRRSATPLPKAPVKGTPTVTPLVTTPGVGGVTQAMPPTAIDIRLTRTLPADVPNDVVPGDGDINLRKPKPFMYREPGKLFDKLNDADILRKHIPKKLELDKVSS